MPGRDPDLVRALILRDCQPVVTEGAYRTLRDTAAEGRLETVEALRRLDAVPPDAMAEAVAGAFADLGCALDFTEETAAGAEDAVIGAVAARLDLGRVADPLLRDRLHERIGAALEALEDMGRMVFDEATETARLTDCP
ncbi:hypothetical protein DXV76_09555 [Rhodobacteraceae bacterium CCMM004]|nr:hypothetical protein DXV76_09555 [Rhodobacteraceae bacterium CCMM004]